MRSVKFLAALALLGVGVALAQDNIEGPWGTANGDLFGRARTTDIPVMFGNGSGAAEAWRISTTANGSNRSAGYTSLTFDAAGNIYWRSFTGQLSSVDKNGAWRWNATTDGSTVINLGGFTDSSAVVGGAAVYVLGGGAAGNDYVAAINKATGVRIWQTALPNADYSSRDQLTPVLYNGKLYILGRSNGFNCEVYRVNAADGALDWNNTVDITVLLKGCMTFVPDAFASGEHGLYVNGDSGSGTDFFGEAYGIKITATAASLIWEVDGGKAARSHLIYNPVTDLLYSHTWHDYGGEFYAYDPQNGNVTVNNNTTDAGHGFYDVGCLDFDNNSIVTGGFSGQVVIYQDTGGGTTTDQVYTYSDGQCPTSWYGEYRVYGQLLCCNGETVLVSGTNSRNNDLGATYKARAAVMKVPGNIPAEDSAMYIDDVVVSEGPDVNNLTQIFADDFESYTLGDLPPQGGWEDDPGAPQTDVAKVVDDPTGADPNQCAAIDAAGGGGGWVGMYHNFTDSTQDVVRIQWRQYREGMGDNAWPYYGDFAGDFAGGWNFGWDINDGRYFAYHFGGGQVKPERCFWQTVTVTYSNINDPTPANRTVTIDIDNPAQSASATQDQGFNQTDAIYGVGFELEATPPVDGGDYNDPWVAFDTQIANDHGFTTRSGVLAGPDGKLYYLHANTAELVALKPLYLRGDANCDGSINGFDVDPFVDVLTGGSSPCSPVAVDVNGDGSANGFDVDGFVDILTGVCP
ncbi:MAG: hypothetical protein CHACPFDD_02624 [Phycisphaerae bacterium]|nr:hypothetical protein [Phycisphaerae bacterium]